MQTETEKLANENDKKPYQTPILIKHGTIEEITGMPFDTPEISGFDADGPG